MGFKQPMFAAGDILTVVHDFHMGSQRFYIGDVLHVMNTVDNADNADYYGVFSDRIKLGHHIGLSIYSGRRDGWWIRKWLVEKYCRLGKIEPSWEV